MRKRRSNERTHKNLYAEKSLLLERKNLSQPLKYKKDSLSIDKTTPKSKSTVEFHSRKSNELTKISKQQIRIAGTFCSVRLNGVTLKTPSQMSSRRALRSTSRLKSTLNPKEGTVADKIETRLKSKKQQNILEKKALHISQTKLLKSQNKSKGPQGQNGLHCNTVVGVSRFPQGSPNKTTRSSRCSIRLQSHEFLKSNSENVQPSVSPEFKKQQDILNVKTPCIPKKLWPRSSNTIKRLERQNEDHHNTVINVSGVINESPNETARSSRRSMRSQSQEFLKNKSDNVQLSKLSVSPEFKKQKNILNEKTPCMPKKLRCKSSNKMKELQEQNEVHHNTVINVSGFINESPNETARSSRSIRSQSQEFLKDKSDNVQLSKLSVSPEFKKQQNILNEKTPCMPKKLRRKSLNKTKDLEGQNKVHYKTGINESGFINESPNETARSSRRSLRLQSQEFLKDKSDNVQLSKLSVSPEFKKQKNILNEKTPCMPKNLRRKSSNKMKELQEQNEVHHNTGINVSGFINESPNETARSSRRSLRLQSQEFLKDKSDNVQLSKLSVSPEFKKQKNILNEKTPCMPKNLRRKSSNKMKELQEQNEVHHNTGINVSGFINESPSETARSSRKRKGVRSQSQEFLSKEPDIVQLSKLSVSPEFKKQQNILNEKTPCMPKKLRRKSLNKTKDLEGQNKVHYKTGINESGFINESPNETARSSRRSLRLQSQEFFKNKSDNVHLSKLSISPEFKKQQNILSDKTPMPKKLRLKSSDKIKELQEQNELQKTAVNGSEFINKSPNETARSSRKGKRLQLSKCLRNSTKQQKGKQLITPNRKSNKHSPFAQKNIPVKKKIYVRKSSEKLQKRVRSKSCLNVPVDDLAIAPFIQRQTKSDGYKLPGKNTLKRKRFIIERMKKADEEYEDDIYEEREFTNFINMLPDTSDSELSYPMATPKLGFSLTPQIHCKTPAYKDCFSPTQYALSRKIAEECFYRNKKRKSKSKPEIPAVPEKKKIDFDEILENACKVQKEVEKLAVEESDSDDNYFTDEEN